MAKLTLQEVGQGYSAATDLNANNDLLEAAVENTLSRDGTSPNQMEAQLDMNENRIINLADGINPQDAVTLSQIDDLIGGAGVVLSVGEGTGIDVTGTSSLPVVNLSAASIASLALADTSAQRDDNFVVFSASANMTAERVLTAGTNITLDTATPGQIIVNSTGGGVSDHGALTGLSDDDHPQYAEIAGTESITGTWTFGADLFIADTFELIVGHTAHVLTTGIDVVGTTTADASVGISRFAASALGPEIQFAKSRSAVLGTNTIVQDNDALGRIVAMGGDGTNYDEAAAIEFRVDGTPGAGTDMPGEIAFQTSPDGSATLADRMTISNVGAVHISSIVQSTTVPALRIGDSGATQDAANLSIVAAASPTIVLEDTSGNAFLKFQVDTTSGYLEFDDGSGSGFLYCIVNGVTQWTINPTNDGTFTLDRPIDQVKVEAIETGTLATTENNYALGLHNAIFATPAGGNTTITGIAAPSDPSGLSGTFSVAFHVTIVNVSTVDSLILAHQNASSTAANRFILPGAANVTLAPAESCVIAYHPATDRWYLVSRT